MKKVVNASIGGRAFALDDDAYERLSSYFDHFKARLERDSRTARDEVMADLEGRIAELFTQGTGGVSYRVVSLDLVNKVVGQLGMPDGSPEPLEDASKAFNGGHADYSGQTSEGPDLSYGGDQGRSRKRLFRDPDNKAIGGVCSGVAAFFNIDITIVRIITLIAFLFGGTGLVVYLVLWIVVPKAKTPAEKCELHGLDPTAENMAKYMNK